jgi:AAA+ superfamily predicted ATPase
MSAPLAYELRRLASRLLACAEAEPPVSHPPGELAGQLATSFGLSALEVDLALLVLGLELDAELAGLFAAAAPAGASTELALLAVLVPSLEHRLAAARVIGAGCRLVRSRILRRLDDGTLVATRRFRATSLGDAVLAELPGFASRIAGAPVEMPWVTCPSTLAGAMYRDRAPGALCVVTGPTGAGKTLFARSLALSMSQPALEVDLAAAAGRGDVAGEICELLEDAALAGMAVVLDNAEGLVRGETRFATSLAATLDDTAAQVVLVVENLARIDPRLVGRALSRVVIGPPPPEVRRQLWQAAGLADPHAVAAELVLTPRQIANAATLVERAGIPPLEAAVAQLPIERALTVPDRGVATLDALVLPQDTRDEIVEIIGAIRSRHAVHESLGLRGARGRSISALFDGDSGTGKTLACEVIAVEVGLPLARVNVSTLVDKYIGETEKNLARVFDEAKTHGGILFFDEADAMFGARTDVSRAQDRYANLATNLLLQLMEDFTGIVLLTTNLKRNIDQAFMRRLTFKVYFEPPEPAERERLWRLHLPAPVCGRTVDVTRLARAFELSGGSIRAASMRAAYRAAAAARAIDMSDLIECAKLEAAGLGRVAQFQ